MNLTENRSQRAWIVIVILLAVVAALVSWRHLRDGRSQAAPGTTLAATDAFTARTTAAYLLLPDGRYDIRSTRPLDDVPADPAVRSQRAPEDGSFVGLQIVLADVPAVTRWSFGQSSRRQPIGADFALVADGRRYPLTKFDAYGSEVDKDDVPLSGQQFVSQRVYVAVAGSPQRLQLEASYGGRRQRVDLQTGSRQAGVFAPLYENKAVDRDCGTAMWTAGFSAEAGPGPACTVDLVQRTPYYPTFGWAPSGRTWVVVGVHTRKPEGLRYRAGDRVARYEAFGLPDVAATLDGVAAKATGLFSNVFGSTRRDVSLFAAKAGPSTGDLGVVVTYDHAGLRADSAPAGADYSPSVTSSWQVPLS